MRKSTLAYQLVILGIFIYIGILTYNQYKRRQYKKYREYKKGTKERLEKGHRQNAYSNDTEYPSFYANNNTKYENKSQQNFEEDTTHASKEKVFSNDHAKIDDGDVDIIYPSKNVYSKKMTKLEIRENLGRSTWTLLHTMAAVYPGIPSNQHKKDLLTFIKLLSKLYPCGDCAEHFQKLLEEHPPKVNDHDAFAQWLCSAHNIVNKRLGKKTFDCSKVDEVWECGCEGT